jgi:hypothetical protein
MIPEECDDMEMPTPCQRCGDIFDLNDGRESEKWYPGTVICETCAGEETVEVEQDTFIEALEDELEDAIWTVNDCHKRLKQLSIHKSVHINLD